MFGENRQQLRQYYHNVWQKMQTGSKLSALEQNIAQVIEQHKEYHQLFTTQDNLDRDYSVEQGQTNPYLHMALHLSLHEQITTDRPQGIRSLYGQLLAQYPSAHELEHHMMESLTESLWQAQRYNQPPSEQVYLSALRKLLEH